MIRLVPIAAALLLLPGNLPAQDVLAARAGLIYAVEGETAIDGQPLDRAPASYPLLPLHAELSVGCGEATLVLAPGVFLDVHPESSVRLRDHRLMQPRVEITGGTARLRITDRLGKRQVAIVAADTVVRPDKPGDYTINALRIDVASGRLRVTHGNEETKLRDGDHILLPPAGPVVAQDTHDPTVRP